MDFDAVKTRRVDRARRAGGEGANRLLDLILTHRLRQRIVALTVVKAELLADRLHSRRGDGRAAIDIGLRERAPMDKLRDKDGALAFHGVNYLAPAFNLLVGYNPGLKSVGLRPGLVDIKPL